MGILFGRGERTRSRSATPQLRLSKQVSKSRLPCDEPLARLTFDSLRAVVVSSLTMTIQKAHKNVDSLYGRGERTRTFDLTVPNRARYQLRHTPLPIKLITNFVLLYL